MSENKHAILAPSAAHRWLHCPGSVVLCRDIQKTSSEYADEGLRAHDLAAKWLNGQVDAKSDDPDLMSYVPVYVNAVRSAAEGKIFLIEHPVDISKWTTEPDAKGTVDAVIIDLSFESIEIHDLKFGYGHVVDAEHNEQLMLYALGVLDFVEALYIPEVKSVKLVIHQPRRDHLSEWEISREELLAFGEKVKDCGSVALGWLKDITDGRNPGIQLRPSEKTCTWCAAKATCPALREKVHAEALADFGSPESSEDLPSPDTLALVEQWLSAMRDRIFAKLQKFEPVPGWKLVRGKRGNRAWDDTEKVEKLVKTLRVKDAFEKKLKSPAQLEKSVSEKKWKLFEERIKQADGQPTMVAESDKRPAITQQASPEDFDAFA